MVERDLPDGHWILERVAALCHDLRAEEVVALDVRELVEYMDYLFVASARSERQSQAIAERIVAELAAEGVRPLSVAGQETGNWICLDLVVVVVHIFTPEARARYDLELLWADAPRVPLPETVPDAERAP